MQFTIATVSVLAFVASATAQQLCTPQNGVSLDPIYDEIVKTNGASKDTILKFFRSTPPAARYKRNISCGSQHTCYSSASKNVAICLDRIELTWEAATGTQGNFETGQFFLEDGSRGNIYAGPFPTNLGPAIALPAETTSVVPDSVSSTTSVVVESTTVSEAPTTATTEDTVETTTTAPVKTTSEGPVETTTNAPETTGEPAPETTEAPATGSNNSTMTEYSPSETGNAPTTTTRAENSARGLSFNALLVVAGFSVVFFF